MHPYLGIILAVVALLSWGFGDFYIQRSSRVIGVWKMLFSVGVVGFIALFPFVRNEILFLQSKDIIILAVLGVVIFFASLLNFAALKNGKIAIVEPLIGMELPLTVALSIGLGYDKLNLVQLFLVAVVFVGLLMIVTMHHKHLHQNRSKIEKGVMLAAGAAIGLALTNFLVGLSSSNISPLMVIWFAHTEVAIICAVYLIYERKFHTMFIDFKSHLKATLGQSVLYNMGWLSFAFATTTLPTSIVATISESYIILGVILGIFVNRERLRRNQFIGIILVVSGILALSMLTAN